MKAFYQLFFKETKDLTIKNKSELHSPDLYNNYDTRKFYLVASIPITIPEIPNIHFSAR